MITFLGYIDRPEEMLGGKKRCVFGCDDDSDVASLPTTAGLTLADGTKTAAPAPWSVAWVRGGNAQVLGTDGTWSSWLAEGTPEETTEETPEETDDDAGN